MEKILRTYVDIDKPISTYKLSPLEKISVAFRISWRGTRFYQINEARKKNQANKERLERQEALKLDTLERLYLEFHKGNADSVVLRFPRVNKDDLLEILAHRDFVGYRIEFLYCHPDLEYLLGSDLPLMVKFTQNLTGRR